MSTMMANGKIVDMPTDASGRIDASTYRTVAGIDEDEVIVRQHVDGSNEIIDETKPIDPEVVGRGIPRHKRGAIE